MESLISKLNIKVRRDCPLAELTSFKVGGPADCVLYPQTIEQCSALLAASKERGKRLIFLGNGSNVLGSDKGCRDYILRTDGLSTLSIDKNGIMTVGAGVKGVKASSFAAKSGYSGLEFLYGIPGTVGGAVFMNAGAYDGSMDQVVLRTKYLDDNGKICTLDGKDHSFGYRKSFFMEHPNCLIIETELQLRQGNSEEIFARIEELQARRREKQPLEYPSAGSTFKRPAGYFAGKLIQDAGLAGYSIGGAQVSAKHCGFIINSDHATGADVRNLISYVKKTVLERFGVELECEVRYLGEE